jgi:uncharacterized membrane protein
MGVNLRGDVVGSLGSQGMVWHADGRRTTLRGLDGGFSVTQGAAIAPSGVSVGMAQVNNVEQAARWDPSGAATALPGLCDGCASTATAVASDGWAAGQVDRLRGRDWAPHAALWHGTRLIDLSPDDTDTASRAQGVNALGVAVGWRQDGVRRMAMRWQDGTTVILPALRDGAQDRCEALAVNVHGDIVGYCTGESLEHRAVVWRRSGALRDLNTQLPHRLRDAGWRLSQAAAVSDKGYITGEAVNTRTGERRAFLLTRQR